MLSVSVVTSLALTMRSSLTNKVSSVESSCCPQITNMYGKIGKHILYTSSIQSLELNYTGNITKAE